MNNATRLVDQQLSLDAIGIVTGVVSAAWAILAVVWYLLGQRWHPRFQPALEAGAGCVSSSEPIVADEAGRAGDRQSSTEPSSTDGAEVEGGHRKPVDPFPPFTFADKADFCSRMNSTLHCLVVVPGLIITLLMNKWDATTLEPVPGSDIRAIQGLFAFSAAYFAFDLILCVAGQVNLWIVFAVHHVAALIAIGSNIYNPNCRWGTTYCIGVFLLVEIATIPLNLMTFVEQVGWDSRGCFVTTCFYSTIVSWFVTRIVLPITTVALIFDRVLLARPADQRYCLIAGVTSAVYLTLFCFVVFVGVLVPQVVQRCKSRTSVMDDSGTPSA